jgi:cell division protein FtsB
MKNKIVIRIVVMLLFLGVVAFLVFNENGLMKYLKVRKELKQMETQIKIAEKKLTLLELEIDSLQTSKEKIERVAREKFHMMKKNEKAFRVEEK